MYTGNLRYAMTTLSDQAHKAYHSLLSLFTRVKLDIKTKLYLFDCLVAPIILYGSEVWGIYDFKEVDKLHIYVCKTILGVKKTNTQCSSVGWAG